MDLTNAGAFSGANLENARDHNRRVTIETLRVHGPLSRADVARITGLSVQTTSNIAEELIGASLLLEKPVSSLRGKPPKILSINPDGAYSIGLQLDHNWLIGVLLDLAGVRRGEIMVPVDSPNPQSGLAALEEAARQLVADAHVQFEQICGVSVVMPGPFEVDSLASDGPTILPGWADVAVADRLAERLNLPVSVENDATAAAMGEHYFGVARRHRNVVVIFVGTGLGGGILINGQPYRGAFRNAGEIGHLTVYPDGRRCYCGNQGCAETYLSVHAAYEHLGYEKTPPTYDELLHRLHTGERQFDTWMDKAAAVLRLLVVNLENMFDPETVVVNGFMPYPVLAELERRALPLPPSISSRQRRETPRVILGAAGLEVAALGAAVLPLFYSFGHLTPVSAAMPLKT
ncbi:ROK family transcriptional regulator [Ensifer adhaerens]|uniref:ROK family transcriptional regulator n=1 Tax=Ensifer adhaerens TaxID=106592 RepID=UPI000CF0C57C|nr:ROK family transcriptional regulator [Ensifer adhaerens]